MFCVYHGLVVSRKSHGRAIVDMQMRANRCVGHLLPSDESRRHAVRLGTFSHLSRNDTIDAGAVDMMLTLDSAPLQYLTNVWTVKVNKCVLHEFIVDTGIQYYVCQALPKGEQIQTAVGDYLWLTGSEMSFDDLMAGSPVSCGTLYNVLARERRQRQLRPTLMRRVAERLVSQVPQSVGMKERVTP